MSDRAAPVPAELLFAAGAISQYVGAAVAIDLFDRLDAQAVALLRVASAGIVVSAVGRAWRRRWTAVALRQAAAFGAALAIMNLSFYLAIDRLPLGTAVAIEFVGPITVAAVGARTRRSVLALVLAAAGIVALADVQLQGNAAGFAWALAAGAAWAAYIVLGHRFSRSGVRDGGLGVAMVIGALAIAPAGVPSTGPILHDPELLVLAAAAGVLSSAVPYGIDQVVLRRLDRDRFALLQALLPVTATAVGFVALNQRPTGTELIGIALVGIALTWRGRS